jgi:polyisoprenoid-binding protein YceI
VSIPSQGRSCALPSRARSSKIRETTSAAAAAFVAALAHAGFAQDERSSPPRPAFQRFAVVAERSEVGFDASSTLHDFTGRSRRVSGELRARLDDLASCAGGSVRVEAKSLDTGVSGRDKDMREELEVSTYPTIEFRLAGATGTPGTSSEARPVELAGAFVIHGRRVPVDARTSVVRLEAGGLWVEGRAKLRLSDFDIDPPSILFVDVDDEVEAWWKLALEPVPAEQREATRRVLDVVETWTEDGETRRRASSEALWTTDGGATLWERRSTWVVRRDEVRRVRLATGAVEIAEVTAAGESPEVERADGRLVAMVGGETRLEVEGLRGSERVCAVLAGVDGLAPAIRDLLHSVEGVPTRAVLRRATAQGERTLEIRVGDAVAGLLPDWALSPEEWTPPPAEGGAGTGR